MLNYQRVRTTHCDGCISTGNHLPDSNGHQIHQVAEDEEHIDGMIIPCSYLFATQLLSKSIYQVTKSLKTTVIYSHHQKSR